MRVPEGENELRHICEDCGYVDYYNPKLVSDSPSAGSLSHVH